MSQYGFNKSGSYIIDSATREDVYSHHSINEIGNDLMRLHNASENELGLSQTRSFTSSEKDVSVLSNVEQAILRSQVPIDISDSEEIIVNGQRGVWANKSEVN